MTLELRNDPQQARSTKTLERLTQAAREVVDEVGVDRMTTAQIALRAGLSIGTVYRYFPDRFAVLDAIEPERAIADEVREERRRQNAKWGEQNHPDGTGPLKRPLFDRDDFLDDDTFAQGLAAGFTSRTNERASAGTVTWTDILLEEVFEALAEDDLAKLRAELVQVAAVAQQWVAAIDRRAT